MSLEAMRKAFKLQGISPTDVLVLLALGNFADEEWQCFPSKTTLALMTNLKPRAITMSIKRLEEAGYLAREMRNRPNGSQTSNRFTLHLGEGGDFAAPPASNAPPPRRPVQGVGAGDAPPEPSVKDQEEPSGLVTREPFEIWWDAYPRKVAKVAARKAWRAVPAKIGLEDLLDRTLLFASHVVGKDLEHVAHPATWLNGERWLDVLEPRSQTDGRNTAGADRGADQHSARIEAMESGARAAIDRRRRWAFGNPADRGQSDPEG